MSPLLLSMPVLLVAAAVAVAMRSNRAAATVAIASQALAAVLVLLDAVPILCGGATLDVRWWWPRPIEQVVFRVDALAAFFLAWSLPMTLVGTVYGARYLEPYFTRGRHGGSHFALLNLIALSFVLVYSAQNALVFLLGWETAAVAAWLLVIWDYQNQKIRFAGFNYLVSTHVGLFVLVAAFMLLHSRTQSMDLAAFGRSLGEPGGDRATIFAVLGVAFALKAAFFPFHTWLPRAHSAAPAHVSALMSGVIHKAGIFAFLRFTFLAGRPDEWMGWTVLAFGGASAFFGVLSTATQRDLKRLLGYSSTENVGIAAVAFGVGYLGWTWDDAALTTLGFGAGLLHVLHHAVFKCLLFYAAGSVYRATHTVDIERLGGLAKKLPLTTAASLVGGVAIAALPPLNGFVSELMIYGGLLSGAAPTRQADVAFVAAAAGLAFVGGVAFLGNQRDPTVHVSMEEPLGMSLPLVIHALLVLVLGVAPQLGFALVAPVLRSIPASIDVAAAERLLATAGTANAALAAVLAVVIAARWWWGRTARRTPTWGCGYDAPSPRMQTSGSSFAAQLARLFEPLMPALRRQRLPEGPFPQAKAHVSTHHPDAVEKRMFEVLGQGEDLVTRVSERFSEQPRVSFAGALLVLVVVGAVLFATRGP